MTRVADTPERPSGGGLRERNKAERRTRIIEAARDLLREDPEAITTERIAERARVSPATVYNLIGPREKVWEAVAVWFGDELERRLAGGAGREPLDRVRHVMRVTVDLFAEEPRVARTLFRAWEESGVVLRGSPAIYMRAALEDARAAGILRDDVDTGALASTLASASVGLLHQWGAGLLDDRRLHALADRALDVALAAGAAEEHRERLQARLARRTRRRPAA